MRKDWIGLGMFFMKLRRMREDLIEVYKMMSDIARIDSSGKLFPKAEVVKT